MPLSGWIRSYFEHLVTGTRVPYQVAAQEIYLVAAGFCRSIPNVLALFGKDHLIVLQ